MERPYSTYKKNKKDSKFKIESNKIFLNKYIKHTKELDPFKLNENDIIKKNKKIIPGKIYTFNYDPISKDVLSYYDTRPIVLLHTNKTAETGNHIVSGINLNFLPEQIRITIIDQFFKLFQKEIENDIDKIWDNKLSFIVEAIQFLKNWLKTRKIFERYPNVNFSFAYRNYIIKNITNLRVIEYDDWEILPFIESKEIIGKSLAEIYNDYLKSLLKK